MRTPHVQKRQSLLRRLEGRHREAAPQILPQRQRRDRLRDPAEEARPKPYRDGTVGQWCARLVAVDAEDTTLHHSRRTVARALGEVCAEKTADEVDAADIAAVEARWGRLAHNTRRAYSQHLRVILKAIGPAIRPETLDAVAAIQQGDARTVVAGAREEALIRACGDLPLLFVLLCALDLGIRSGTASAITPADIVGGRVRRISKNRRAIDLPLTPELARLAAMQAPVPRDGSPQFVGATVVENLHGAPIKARQWWVSRRWCNFKKRAGLRPELRIHDLRRTCAQRLLRYTGDLADVQELLGHRHMSTTFQYLSRPATRLSLATLMASRDAGQEKR